MAEKQQSDQQQPAEGKRRSEGEGLLRFGREMAWALAMALVAIVYVIQAFKIPTGSMENTLLVGDFLLGLKFIYGAPVLPFTHYKLPGITDPKPGDIIIFRYPGRDKKDYIKRCVAGPGQTIEIDRNRVIVDGEALELPPKGQYVQEGLLFYPPALKQVETMRSFYGIRGDDTLRLAAADSAAYDTIISRLRHVVFTETDTMDVSPERATLIDGRYVNYGEIVVDQRLTYFAPLRIPAKGDTITVDGLPIREFVFLRHLIHQENPGKPVRTEIQLYLDGEYANDKLVSVFVPNPRNGRLASMRMNFAEIPWDAVDEWQRIDDNLRMIREQFPRRQVEFRRFLHLDGQRVTKYVVRKDNYFMMGDNRDNSLDSRYWGYLNRTNVKAKALILYFSWNSYHYCDKCHTDQAPDGHYYDGQSDARCAECGRVLRRSAPFYKRIRFNRIGKLIRSWDGVPESSGT